MNSFIITFIAIFVASIIDVGIIEFIIFASNTADAKGKQRETMWWLLTVINFVFGIIVAFFFSIIGGVCAIANTQRHINQKMPRNSKK